eukprot:5864745-Pyramimonas_sp.AAC.1
MYQPGTPAARSGDEGRRRRRLTDSSRGQRNHHRLQTLVENPKHSVARVWEGYCSPQSATKRVEGERS